MLTLPNHHSDTHLPFVSPEPIKFQIHLLVILSSANQHTAFSLTSQTTGYSDMRCSLSGKITEPWVAYKVYYQQTPTLYLHNLMKTLYPPQRSDRKPRDTSGQGRFCTIFRSYSRGAQGILLVYDIANRWSFEGIDRWIREIDEHAPGVPRILVGNRLHLAFKRQVPTEQARAYAEKNGMTFFEVSPLCNFNVIESFTELSRIVLMRHGMEKFWKPNRVFTLQDLCCRAIVSCTPVHLIDKLPLPVAIKSHLKSFSMANGMNAVMMHGRSYSLANAAGGSKGNSLKRSKSIKPPQSPPQNCTRNNCKIS
ncbi:ras-related protein Rab-40C isoform X1 [Salmo trutta]|uniref:ras-related protein Rab-40C isoform X1 n=1 Tax=Salmo trutta TaxID=8032 RepID=UPI00113299C2|nr:ras-related protein Rab-40C isoform X1 [Salmo trutta]